LTEPPACRMVKNEPSSFMRSSALCSGPRHGIHTEAVMTGTQMQLVATSLSPRSSRADRASSCLHSFGSRAFFVSSASCAQCARDGIWQHGTPSATPRVSAEDDPREVLSARAGESRSGLRSVAKIRRTGRNGPRNRSTHEQHRLDPADPSARRLRRSAHRTAMTTTTRWNGLLPRKPLRSRRPLRSLSHAYPRSGATS